jgi:hypothetical protein
MGKRNKWWRLVGAGENMRWGMEEDICVVGYISKGLHESDRNLGCF